MSSLLTIFLLYIVAFVHAAPLLQRDVVSPPITSPNASTVWNVGDKVTVTWDTSSIPEPKNFTGQLILGFQTTDSENLDLDHPLATGFQLIDGQVSIIVPDVAPKKNYIVVLIGDSGNASPEFTIVDGVDPSSSSPSASSSPTSSSATASSPSAPATTSAESTTSATPTSSSLSPMSPTITTPSSIASPSTTLSASSTSSAATTGVSGIPVQNQGDASGALSRSAPTLSLCVGAALALMALL